MGRQLKALKENASEMLNGMKISNGMDLYESRELSRSSIAPYLWQMKWVHLGHMSRMKANICPIRDATG